MYMVNFIIAYNSPKRMFLIVQMYVQVIVKIPGSSYAVLEA